jgi:hypothetical protein
MNGSRTRVYGWISFSSTCSSNIYVAQDMLLRMNFKVDHGPNLYEVPLRSITGSVKCWGVHAVHLTQGNIKRP